MMESLKYFLLRFWPNILDDIWHDCKALGRAFKDTRDVYRSQKLINRNLSNPTRLGLYEDSSPLWASSIERRHKIARFGHDPIKQVLSRKYPDGTNIYKASLLNLRFINSIFASSRYQSASLLAIFLWGIRNIVFKRHFKGWFRSYLFKNMQRLKEYSYAYVYSFGSWWPIASLRWVFIRVVFRVLTNLFFLGPLFKFVGTFSWVAPSLPSLPTLALGARIRLLIRTFPLSLSALSFFLFRVLPGLFFKPFDVFFRLLIAFDITGVILFSLFRHLLVIGLRIVSFPFVIPLSFLLNRFVRFVRPFVLLRSSLVLTFFHKRFFYVFQYFAYVLYFKSMLVRHLASIRIRIRLRRKKPNPIRRFSNWVNYTRYKLSRYQTEKVFYALGQFLLVLPTRFSKTAFYSFLSSWPFQVILWRGFPFEKPYLSNFLSKQAGDKFFSYFSIYDDLTLTNFFSNETAFPTLRLLFYEYDDWSANFEEFDEVEDHILDMSQSIRSRRLFIVNIISRLLRFLKVVPSFLWRWVFSGQLFWRVALLPYMFLDFSLALVSFLASLVKSLVYAPIYASLYLIAWVRSTRLTFSLNIQRSERYGLYSAVYFILTAFISLFLFLEFFYIFGERILLVQEFLMRNLDSYTYNYLFILLFPLFTLSLVSNFFGEIWRESKYYLVSYPIVVHSWLLFYLIRWSGKKKFGLVGNFADYLNRDAFWFNDALHPILGYFYLNWQPFLKYKRFTGTRPHEAYEFDAKQATFDFVTSLF